MKAMVIRRKPKKIDIRIKVNPLNKWAALNTLGVISVGNELLSRSKAEDSNGKRRLTEKEAFSAGPWEKNYGRG